MQYDLFKNPSEDVDGEKDGKVCCKCKEYKTLEAYEWFSGSTTWSRPECKQCRTESRKTREELKKYTPPPSEDHTCPICERDIKEISLYTAKRMSTFVLDHDHEKKVFRGWLCNTCNAGLGLLGDNLTALKRAYNYLKEFKDEHS